MNQRCVRFSLFILAALLVSACGDQPGARPFSVPSDLPGLWSSAGATHGLTDATLRFTPEGTFERLLPTGGTTPAVFGKITEFKWGVRNRRTFRFEPAPGVVDPAVASLLLTIEAVTPDEYRLHFQTEVAKLSLKPGAALTAPVGAVELPIPQSNKAGDTFVLLRRITDARLVLARNEFAAAERAAIARAADLVERKKREEAVVDAGRAILRGNWLAEKVEYRQTGTGILLRETEVTKLLNEGKGLAKSETWSFKVSLDPKDGWIDHTPKRGKEAFTIRPDKKFMLGPSESYSILSRTADTITCLYTGVRIEDFAVWRFKKVPGEPALPEPTIVEPAFDGTLVPADKAPEKLRQAFAGATKGKWHLQRIDLVTPHRQRMGGVAYTTSMAQENLRLYNDTLLVTLEFGDDRVSMNERASIPLEVKHRTAPDALTWGNLILLNKLADGPRLAFETSEKNLVVFTYGNTARDKDVDGAKVWDFVNLARSRDIAPAGDFPVALDPLTKAIQKWETKPGVVVPMPWAVAPILKLDPRAKLTVTLPELKAKQGEFRFLKEDEMQELKLSIEHAVN